jgi:hypothetical protein
MSCWSCPSVQVGPLTVPQLVAQTGDWLCLHLPPLRQPDVLDRLIKVLTGRQRSAAHSTTRVEWAEPVGGDTGFWESLFFRQNVVSWLHRRGGVPRAEARAVARQLGIPRHQAVTHLGVSQRLRLGVEAAVLRGAGVLVFSTAGCDLPGVQAVYEQVAARLDRVAAIHLSFPYATVTEGEMYRPIGPELDRFAGSQPEFPFVRVSRTCFRAAACVELTAERCPSTHD